MDDKTNSLIFGHKIESNDEFLRSWKAKILTNIEIGIFAMAEYCAFFKRWLFYSSFVAAT